MIKTVEPDDDLNIYQQSPDTNYGDGTDLNVRKTQANQILRTLLRFTLPNGSGKITKVAVWLKSKTDLSDNSSMNIYPMIQTGWTEVGATWNKYDETNNWATAGMGAGTDYTDTTIKGFTPNAAGEWTEIDILGGDSTNPLTLNWGSIVDVMIRGHETSVNVDTGKIFYSKENDAANRPYLEVTYEPYSAFLLNFL